MARKEEIMRSQLSNNVSRALLPLHRGGRHEFVITYLSSRMALMRKTEYRAMSYATCVGMKKCEPNLRLLELSALKQNGRSSQSHNQLCARSKGVMYYYRSLG
jgi:hypothetical protein